MSYREAATPDGPRLLGRYKLLGRLASGRLGPVWLAHTVPPGIAGPGVCVCVKELETVPDGLFDEVKRAARLSHRNVNAIFELAVAGPTRFLCLEYVQGGPLAALPREPRLLAGVAAQVREGVRAAHAIGVVHGALTSDDVFVTEKGRAVVLGFGTARFRPGAQPTVEHDLAAVDAMFADAEGPMLPELAIGSRAALAFAPRIKHERALGATGGWTA